MQLTPTGTAQLLLAFHKSHFGTSDTAVWCFFQTIEFKKKPKQTTKHPRNSPKFNLPCTLYNVLWSDSTTSPRATQPRGFLPLMLVCQDCVILLFVSAAPWTTNCTLLYSEYTSEMNRACSRVAEQGAHCSKNAGVFFADWKTVGCFLLFLT